MPLYLTIATINGRGLRDPARRLAFFAYARRLDVQVLCLQETYSQPRVSDHDTVITQFDIHLQPSRGRGYWKNNVTCF